ncbi:PQQ-dependent sugar dehydrogenase [Roseomonas sp. USHLN139]|uniref:PQQ-dependent sugar dehydrogenase n=1 Tax=Roseomonas sp. USHLN139 TaxID=3081298 RepID=UPI003B015318
MSAPSRRALLLGAAAATLPLVALRAAGFNDAAPNARDQRPAFAGQTRAPVIRDSVTPRTQVVAGGLENPWGLAELPGGGWLVTERAGRLRRIGRDGRLSPPIAGLPPVDFQGQGGLLDVAIRPGFAEDRRIWWSYAEPRGQGLNGTSVATGTLSADFTRLEEVRVIFRQQPGWRSTLHFGSRLVFDRQGMLFVTTGERSLPEPRQLAQDVSTHLGKVLRITPEGGAAPGNPALPGGQPEIWSYGHRNLQSAVLGPDGALWTVEHGPRGGDELNRPQPGRNYGWPVISYGLEYSGRAIGQGRTAAEGMEQPLYYWDPVIAPSGLAFYDGPLFPAWRGSLLVGGLSGMCLVRLTLEGQRVTGEARYLEGQARLRDVRVARDGAVMLLTDGAEGALLRLAPA